MTSTPERIWATPIDPLMDGGTYCNAADRPTAPNHDARLYISNDLPTTLEQAIQVPEVRKLVEALAWYGEQARLCRIIHKEGDAGRNALDADGGKRARAALVLLRDAVDRGREMMEDLINVYVVWCVDGPTMVTLLQFEKEYTETAAFKSLSEEQFVKMAWDAEEFEDCFDSTKNSYELVAIFKSQDIHFIY